MNKKRKIKIRKISNFISYFLLIIIIRFVRIIPYKLAIYIGRFLGAFCFHIVRVRRNIVLKNLDIAFGNSKTKKEKCEIAKNSYMNFAMTIVEIIKIPYSKPEFIKQIVQIDDLDKIETLRGENKKNNFIGLTAHLNNWELLGAYLAQIDYPLCVIAKPIHNQMVDTLLNKIRNKLGYEVFYSGDPLKEMIRKSRDGKILSFLADQDARRDGIFIDFFGTPASTFVGPAVFMKLLDLPLLNIFIVRQDIFKHKILVKDILYFPQDKDKEEAIKEITEKHTKILEEVIREYPEQYFWFHKRWKTQKDKTKIYQ